ncbi:GntR family transcriptional regulator [Gallaecimonas mangrovi]|uniref:GntR family transcriptional regulator n=1 Tax=Gallaecimonas mangrovi TaxID=2291597 RepID=UPI000E2022F9|nr:GntR family transcriptional regulator [Gallaecimonas mangrovi]
MFAFDTSASTPLYRQLVEQIKRLIAGGQLNPGDTLPSVRELAQRHAINPMTISKAYSQLEADGLLARQRGKPMTVARQPQLTDPLQLLAEPIALLVQSARQLSLSDAQIVDALKQGLEQYHDKSGD